MSSYPTVLRRLEPSKSLLASAIDKSPVKGTVHPTKAAPERWSERQEAAPPARREPKLIKVPAGTWCA